MALKTPDQYVESLRALEIRAYVGGQRVESIVDNPAIAPHINTVDINTVAKTYELAHMPEHREVMTAISHISGERIHRYTHMFQSAVDLVMKIQMLRLLGQVTGTCFQRCVGLDALNAAYAVSYEIDEAEGTDYHQRFRAYLGMVQAEDLMLAGAMTDPKGHRAKRPSEQEDPDAFVRVVERRPDGVVIRGAKLHNTGGINSHEVLVLPGTGLISSEEDYAIACAVPADAEGVTFIFRHRRQDADGRRGHQWQRRRPRPPTPRHDGAGCRLNRTVPHFAPPRGSPINMQSHIDRPARSRTSWRLSHGSPSPGRASSSLRRSVSRERTEV
jgi:4-hydroxybutyryl-CoA dehydratase / vinylacetyl-CoA-Delta-isomerase